MTKAPPWTANDAATLFDAQQNVQIALTKALLGCSDGCHLYIEFEPTNLLYRCALLDKHEVPIADRFFAPDALELPANWPKVIRIMSGLDAEYHLKRRD